MTIQPSSRRLIVVNDDATQRAALSGLLRKEGYEVRDFGNASAALAALTPELPPALIITDLFMPGIDGWRFCRLLRSPDYWAFNMVPILVVSATFAGVEAARITADLGANAFLAIPIEPAEFLSRVRDLLSGSQPHHFLRVLIVEDMEPLANVLKASFAVYGYQADTVGTVREASEAFTKKAYDAAVLDYHLPDGMGDSLLDAFHAQRPDCVCLMITGDRGSELALTWMKRGAVAYLQKPFQPDYLVELCARARRERALLRAQDLLEERTQKLRDSEEKYARAFQTSPYGIAITRAEDGRFLEVNDAFLSSTGFTREEVLADSSIGLRMWVNEAARQCVVADLQAGRPVVAREFMFRKKNGGLVAGLYSAERIKVNHSPCILSSIADITERKQAEAERERLSVAIEQAAEVFTITDARGIIVYVNPMFETVTGYTRAEVVGQSTRMLKSGEQTDAFYRGLWETISSGKTWQGRLINRKKNGSLYTEEATISPVRDVAGVIVNYVAVKRDITDQLGLEGQLAQARKMESVGRLAGGVAHDFNNILQAILGYAQLAAEQLDPSNPTRRDLEDIQVAARRAAELTRQLLAFARKQTIAPRMINLNETVAGMLKMLRRLIGENIELVWSPGVNLWPVRMDPGQIDQILANLCVNARDAIDGVGAVHLETENVCVDEFQTLRHDGFLPGDYVLLTVSDTGCGMDKKTMAEIFEPFFTTKALGKGSGLGLATVYGIVRQNRGHIGVYSEPGKGTTFRIHLPRHVGAEAVSVASNPVSPTPGGTETVLLVEDDTAILNTMSRTLRKLGYTVLAAGMPQAALRMADEHAGTINLLVTDVVMPGMNGRELAERLMTSRPGLNCLFMSGFTADVITRHGVLEEGVQFIQKPFSMADMAAKIRDTLSGAKRAE